jgi:uncharacterized Ntn-hydrolase superfamily protein
MRTLGAVITSIAVVVGVWLPGVAAAGPAETPTGTFSIVARDSVTGELGVAVQSRAFSVGSAVAWAEAEVGAIATQASTNEAFGPEGLALLRRGFDSESVLGLLLGQDPGRDNRQVGIIDAVGRTASYTGSACLAWAGGKTGPGYACQGNILVSDEVVASMARAFEQTRGELAERLLAALVAAQAAGGDKRGMQSAALLVVRPSDGYPQYRYRYVDLRVEDHLDPINELIRLYGIHQKTDLLEAHLRYAEQYDSTGHGDLAARERGIVGGMLKKAVADSVDDAEYLNNMAWFCAVYGLFLPEALEAAQRAVALSPEAPHILDTLAEIYFRLGERDQAIQTIERAIKLDPESAYYREQLTRFQGAPAR